MADDKIKIKKKDLPKVRKQWKRSPVTKIKESEKKYKRTREKQKVKKVVNNAKNK